MTVESRERRLRPDSAAQQNHSPDDQLTTPPGYPWLTEYEAGRRDGYVAAITLVAERADALDQSWRPPARRTPEQVRADRLASLAPAEGVEEWLERLRQTTLRSLRFVATADRLTPALVAQGITVSPLAQCEWPPVAAPGGGL